MKRPQHFVFLAVISIAGGAATTVGVSWYFARTLDRQQPRSAEQLEFVWPRAVPERWPECEFAARGHVPGRSISEWMAFRNTDEEHVQYGVLLVETGWPMRAMSWEVWVEEIFDQIGRAGVQNRTDGHPDSVWITGYHYGYALHHRLPLMPVWPGFAVNTMFYAGIAVTLWYGPGTVRRAVRRHRLQCASCGYPRRGLAPDVRCPECGAAASRRF